MHHAASRSSETVPNQPPFVGQLITYSIVILRRTKVSFKDHRVIGHPWIDFPIPCLIEIIVLPPTRCYKLTRFEAHVSPNKFQGQLCNKEVVTSAFPSGTISATRDYSIDQM